MKPETSVEYVKGALLVFIGAVMFAAKAVLVKYNYIHYHVDTVPLLALRMLFALPFYLTILIVQRVKQKDTTTLTQKQWIWMLLLGIVGYYLASLFDFWGLQYVTASMERLILFLYPSIVVVLSAIFLKKPIYKVQYIALFITYLGVLFTFIPDLEIGLRKDILLGSGLVFLSALTYALYLIGSGEMIPKIGTVRFTNYAMIISTIVVLAHYFISSSENVISSFENLYNYPKEVYILSLVMAVMSTVIPSFLISAGIKKVGSGNASIIGSIGPIATIVMAAVFLDEIITRWQLVGTIIVLGGVLMISWKGKK